MTFRVGTYRKTGSMFRQPLEVDLIQVESLHVIGSPGEGKSTFLGRLADACMDEGEGILLIDPKGDLAEDVASRTRHLDKLIYIVPGYDPDRVYSLNVLEVPNDNQIRTIVAGNFLEMFKHLGRYDESIMTLVGKYLTASVQTVYTRPNPTIVDVICLLIDEFDRAKITDETRKPNLKWFWDLYSKRTSPEQRSQIDSTLGRLWDFLNFDPTREFIAHPVSTLHLADWLNDGYLVVVNLAYGLDDPDIHRLGNLMVSYLTTQYKLRASKLVSWDRSRRWRLIVDEFHEFSPSPYAQIIRNGRAFNFFPVLAHQDMAQLDDHPHLKGAIGHSSRLAFRRSATDIPQGSYQSQQAFVEAQNTMRKYEADWTFRGLSGTSHHRLQPPNWDAPVIDGQLEEALARSRAYTRAKHELPSLHERYKSWLQGGTIEDDAKQTRSSKRKTQTSREATLPRASEVLPPPPDPARRESDAVDLTPGLFDLFPGRQAGVLGGTNTQDRPTPQPTQRPKSSQRDVPPTPERSRPGKNNSRTD